MTNRLQFESIIKIASQPQKSEKKRELRESSARYSAKPDADGYYTVEVES